MFRILIGCLAWFCILSMAMIAIQGHYGITPGKWLLGLRTVRTTLRTPGFARSLLREVLLYIDSVNLLSWAPGILFITFTNARQRIGDLLAETIVVRANSLAPTVRQDMAIPIKLVPADTRETKSQHA